MIPRTKNSNLERVPVVGLALVWHFTHVDDLVVEPIDNIRGAFQLYSSPFEDERGWFRDSLRLPALPMELWDEFAPQQVSISHSTGQVVRGIHYSVTGEKGSYSQTVTCARGQVEDVLVDFRQGSPTFGGVYKVSLSPESGLTLLIPCGVGHGFRVVGDEAVVVYTMSRAFPEACTRAVRPSGLPVDPWDLSTASVESLQDRTAPNMEEAAVRGLLPRWEGEPR